MNLLWLAFIIPAVIFIVYALQDLFRRTDMGWGLKTMWIVLIVIIPFLGAVLYLLMRPIGRMIRGGGGYQMGG